MNLYELAKQSSEIAKQNGFDDPTWDTLPMKVMLVVTEIVEAVHDAERREALLEELADIALRTLAILYCVWGDSWSSSRIEARKPSSINTFQPMETLLFPVLAHLTGSVEDWRHTRQDDARIRLELALLDLWRLADALGADLYSVCLYKCEKNKARGHLHGKIIRSEG